MLTVMVVVMLPSLQFLAGVLHRNELVDVQELNTQSPVDRLDETVVCSRFAPDQVGRKSYRFFRLLPPSYPNEAMRQGKGKVINKLRGRKTFKKDTLNPDASLRNRSLEGIVFISNLKWNAEERSWEGGSLYDGSSGRTVSARVALVNDKMELRGYMGTPLLGQTVVLHRAPKQDR